MASIRINSIQPDPNTPGGLLADSAAIDHNGNAMPGYRRTIVVPPDIAADILGCGSLELAMAKVVEYAGQLDPAWSRDSIAAAEAAIDAAVAAQQSILSTVTFPIDVPLDTAPPEPPPPEPPPDPPPAP